MNNEIKTAVSITLTTEELIFLLKRMGAPAMLGVDADWFSQLPQAEQAAKLDVAERTLAARNLLVANGELDDVVQSVLAAAFASTRLITIAPLGAETAVSTPIYYYLGSAYHMIHAREASGLHQFSLLANDALLTLALQHRLSPILVGDADYPALELPMAQLESIGTTGLNQGHAAAQKQLLAAGATADVARALAATLAEASYTAVSLIDFEAGEAATQQLVLLHGAGQAWAVVRRNATDVAVQATALTAVEAQLADFIIGRATSVSG